METWGANSEHYVTPSSSSSSSALNGNGNNSNGAVTETLYGVRLSPATASPFRSPVSFLLNYAGILQSSSLPRDSDAVTVNGGVNASEIRSHDSESSGLCSNSSAGEVSIRIIGASEQEQNVALDQLGHVEHGDLVGNRGGIGMSGLDDDDVDVDGGSGRVPLVNLNAEASSGQVDESVGSGLESNSGDSSSYQRYDIQQAAKWVEQILPFSLLLLVVFIRQHLQGNTSVYLFYWSCALS